MLKNYSFLASAVSALIAILIYPSALAWYNRQWISKSEALAVLGIAALLCFFSF